MTGWLRRLFAGPPPPPARELVLRRVVYELFDWETERPAEESGRWYDELYRQVRLEGADGDRLYISWSWGRGQPDYFIDHSPDSFFADPLAAERDVSGSPAWRPLIGRPAAVGHRGRSWQVIEVRVGDGVIYCCSFQSDRVFVMQELRVPTYEPGRAQSR